MYHLAESLKIARASSNPAYSASTSIKPFVTVTDRQGDFTEKIDSVILNSFNVRLIEQHKFISSQIGSASIESFQQFLLNNCCMKTK